MDKIEITGLAVNTRIGTHAWEQRILQRLLIDISIPCNLESCHDDLANTLDYSAICSKITEYVEHNSFKLIETVAENVATLIKEEFQVTQLGIQVSKPDAVRNAANISVQINR
ncbi:dihydroneopterin aldolase [Legionella londiniensis]|uniref:7,8-dihydroneopterin aldolase n=1 Tax=Legionella londiniensis TaxID=45068 RepID=A0A0W0VMJ9_9GAMM|nr:dihydroneopterin aldolase [Legionella londiniensis]KTD21343.1 dihydroneopterin aldolase FolB [Legionella londiniensis]STX93601.1 dihydroneopterin aldolase [Legionella londiniensis]